MKFKSILSLIAALGFFYTASPAVNPNEAAPWVTETQMERNFKTKKELYEYVEKYHGMKISDFTKYFLSLNGKLGDEESELSPLERKCITELEKTRIEHNKKTSDLYKTKENELLIKRILKEKFQEPRVAYSIILYESNENKMAVSKSGALGIPQFMPRTAEAYGLNVYITQNYLNAEKAKKNKNRRHLGHNADYWMEQYAEDIINKYNSVGYENFRKIDERADAVKSLEAWNEYINDAYKFIDIFVKKERLPQDFWAIFRMLVIAQCGGAGLLPKYKGQMPPNKGKYEQIHRLLENSIENYRENNF